MAEHKPANRFQKVSSRLELQQYRALIGYCERNQKQVGHYLRGAILERLAKDLRHENKEVAAHPAYPES
jgi:hypothetical protein